MKYDDRAPKIICFCFKTLYLFSNFPPYKFPRVDKNRTMSFHQVFKNQNKKNTTPNPQPVDFDEFARKWIYVCFFYIQ